MQKIRDQVTLQASDSSSKFGGTGITAAISGRKIRVKLMIAMGLALVCAVSAVYLSNAWFDAQFSRFQTAAVKEPEPETPKIKIVVASKPLKYGVALTPGVLSEIEWPGDAIPTGAFRSTSDLITSEGARVVLTSIALNEPILSNKITSPGQSASLSALLRDGYTAVTVRVDDVLGVAGLITPGDRVDVLWTRVNGQGTEADQTYTEVLLQRVRVLALDQTLEDKTKTDKMPGGYAKAVTIEVSTMQAQKVALATSTGKLFLSLQTVADNTAAKSRRVTLSDLSVRFKPVSGLALPQTETISAAAPAASFAVNKRPASSVARQELPQSKSRLVISEDYAIVGVTRGLERREYNVREAVQPQ